MPKRKIQQIFQEKKETKEGLKIKKERIYNYKAILIRSLNPKMKNREFHGAL